MPSVPPRDQPPGNAAARAVALKMDQRVLLRPFNRFTVSCNRCRGSTSPPGEKGSSTAAASQSPNRVAVFAAGGALTQFGHNLLASAGPRGVGTLDVFLTRPASTFWTQRLGLAWALLAAAGCAVFVKIMLPLSF